MAIRGSVKDGKYMERMGEGEGEGEGFEDYKLIALYCMYTPNTHLM